MHCEKIDTLTIISRSNAIMPGLLPATEIILFPKNVCQCFEVYFQTKPSMVT